MPRVNRDVQRRIAARRERDRRRPSGDRRYRFTLPDAEAQTEDEALLEEDASDQAPAAPVAAASAGARAGARPTTRPFSTYKDEYAYVTRDLRRVAAVIGGLLVALIILYFVLPILVH
jgi:hypothetical protein